MYERLDREVSEANAKAKLGDDSAPVSAQKRKQLVVGKAYGALKKDYKFRLEELTKDVVFSDDEEDDEGVFVIDDEMDEAEVQRKMDKITRKATKDVDEKFKRVAKDGVDELRHNWNHMDCKREELKKKYGDEYLGPLWTDEVELLYQRHCGKRDEAGLARSTRCYFLKYKVEKRLRRRAKWSEWRMRKKVKREQNRALPKIVPVGTSFVFCSRLNFHKFKRLPKCVMKYFGFLALANYHDRIRMRCENVGAVLIDMNEAYTTKKCPHARVT